LVKINNREKKLIVLDGNISSGKTTIGNELAKTGLLAFLEEPVLEWQTKYSENILDLFYKDKKRYSYMFQSAAFLTRAKTWDEILKMTDHSNVIMERSIFSDRFVFARMLHESGDMLDIEWELYCEMWEWLNKRWCNEPDTIVYIKTSPEICFERMGGRGRQEETGVSLGYLKDLHRMHEEWLGDLDNVITIDGSLPFNTEDILIELNII